VRYLAQIYPLQKNKLQELGRLTWLEKDFQFLSSNSTYAPSPETIWKKTKGLNRLKKQKLAILQNLAAFRENLAIEQNRPRRRVITDDVLIELSVNPPTNMDELKEYMRLSHKFLQYNGETILSLIKTGLNTSDEDCPKLPIHEKLSQNEEALADCLMAIVHLSAQNNNISPRCLCSRKELDALIKGRCDLAMLSGWRNELIGKHLLKFLSGDAKLSYHSGQLKFS
jgi:ribonuclease D